MCPRQTSSRSGWNGPAPETATDRLTALAGAAIWVAGCWVMAGPFCPWAAANPSQTAAAATAKGKVFLRR